MFRDFYHSTRTVRAVMADLLKSSELRDAEKRGGASCPSWLSLCENTVTSVGSAPASFTLWRWRRADEPVAETELLCDYGKTGKIPFWIIIITS